jgi:hypothetical protein
MSFAFPPNPSPGDTYTGPNNAEYTWDGDKWIGSTSLADHGVLTGLEDDDHPQYLRVDAGYLQSVVAGENVTIDDTDSRNPVVSAAAGGGGGLTEVQTTVTDADVLLAVNTRNVLTISGLTALRTALFPVGVKGNVIEVELATKAPTDYELVIAGDAGVSMRLRGQTPVTSAEVTRLFILGEAMRWVHDGTDWVCTALDDGRIPSFCSAWLSKNSDGEIQNTVTVPTGPGLYEDGAWTLFEDNAELARLATSEVRIRRANLYDLQVKGTIKDTVVGGYMGCGFQLSGKRILYGYIISYYARQIEAFAAQSRRIAADNVIQYYYIGYGGKGLLGGNDTSSYFTVLEQL